MTLSLSEIEETIKIEISTYDHDVVDQLRNIIYRLENKILALEKQLNNTTQPKCNHKWIREDSGFELHGIRQEILACAHCGETHPTCANCD